MPMYVYDCPNRHPSVEELVSIDEADTFVCICTSCGQPMSRRAVYRATVVGPVWSGLEARERQLLDATKRRGGDRIRGYADAARREQELCDSKGLQPMEQGSYLDRISMEQTLDDLSTQRRIYQEAGGGDAGYAAIDAYDDKSIAEENGLTGQQYINWKNANDRLASSPQAAELERAAVAAADASPE